MPRKTDRPDDWQPDSGRDTRRTSRQLKVDAHRKKKGPKKKAVKGLRLRVIGGDLRGRPIPYHGDHLTRPMKDKTRESLFNILGKTLRGTTAVDLFAGTGALAIESISRGATSGIAIEQNTRAADFIRQTATDLGIADKLQTITGDTFRIAPTIVGSAETDDADVMPSPQTIFICPPYAMWDGEAARLIDIIRLAIDRCPMGSRIIIETERWFDLDKLPGKDWDIRTYGNTVIGLYQPGLICGGDL